MTDNTNLNENTAEAVELDAPAQAAEENTSSNNQKKNNESSPGYLARLVITLTAICVAIAVLLAAVNAVTRDKIAENVMKTKAEAVLDIFDKGTDCELYKTLDDGSEVYLVYRDGNVIGYCAFVSSVGFGGNIDMMVGINSAYETEGVKIVSMSETPGVGTKTDTPEFLNRFMGLGHNDPVGSVDAVSGATISSTAVKNGVKLAHSIEIDLTAVCAEKGCSLITPEMLEGMTEESTEESTEEAVSPDTDASTGDPSVTEPEETDPVSPDTSAEETEPQETEDIPFVNNPGMRDFLYNVDVSVGSDRFVIEIPKDDETATFETTTEPETTEPETTVPVTQPPAVTTEAPVTIPHETTAPETTTTEAPEETTEEPNEMPSWLTTQPEETIPPWLDTQPEETAPSWVGG